MSASCIIRQARWLICGDCLNVAPTPLLNAAFNIQAQELQHHSSVTGFCAQHCHRKRQCATIYISISDNKHQHCRRKCSRASDAGRPALLKPPEPSLELVLAHKRWSAEISREEHHVNVPSTLGAAVCTRVAQEPRAPAATIAPPAPGAETAGCHLELLQTAKDQHPPPCIVLAPS